jgi:hypothetical protein
MDVGSDAGKDVIDLDCWDYMKVSELENGSRWSEKQGQDIKYGWCNICLWRNHQFMRMEQNKSNFFWIFFQK